LEGAIKSFIEDAENELSFEFREALDTVYQQYESIAKSVNLYESCLEKIVNQHADCQKRLRLEGVGVVNAVNLYIALGCTG